ncbi:hypothetical protein PybrP1_010860 [[Pythium] brassicae (nom. inval.)]|nr:hypothetical protein PybrP1_010860 [[Pythium] brassicae (nom. inval.)]
MPPKPSSHHGLHEQKVSAAFRAQQLSAVPSDLLTLKNLVRIDLSMNHLTRFPGAFVAAEMLRLEVLLLQNNLLYVVEDILALAPTPRLRELDLRDNPLRLQNNRVYLLEALLGQPGCDEDLLAMARKDEQLRFLDLPRKNGFPVLMRLNDEWITDREIRDVEAERGRVIEYYKPPASQRFGSHRTGRRFDGSRMTIKQMLRNESRSASIPMARVIQRFQIDADTGDEVAEQPESDRALGSEQNDAAPWCHDAPTIGSEDGDLDRALDDKREEQMIIQRLFRKPPEAGGTQPAECFANATGGDSLQPGRQSLSNESVGPDPAVSGADANCADTETCDVAAGGGDELEEPSECWNYPVSTFDRLGSEDRQYVRAKSKQSGSTLERDDHFFASSVFLDCVAQAERSRRLAVRAVDLLSQRFSPDDAELDSAGTAVQRTRTQMSESRSVPSLSTCSAVASLVETMNAKFSKQLDRATYEKVRAFQAKQLSPDALHIQAAVGDYYQSEHTLQKQRTSQLLSAAQAASRTRHSHYQQQSHRSAPPRFAAAEASIEDSLSKVKLRNAVDLANTLLDPKQQKRVLQQLIDADERVIEEERVVQEQTAHKLRLALINARRSTPDDAKQVDKLMRKAKSAAASPWQQRNWRAVSEQQRQRVFAEQATTGSEPTRRAKPSSSVRKASAGQATAPGGPALLPERVVSPTSHVAAPPRFRSIETVERAAQDALADVNAHDLLVRCAEIRQHADKHTAALAQYRDRFLEDEAAWELMRQDPTNVVRKHLARRLYQHAQEVQIGSTQIFYSPLFSND